MKTYFLFTFILINLNIYAQIGINTEKPLGTLQIVPSSDEDPLIISNIKNINDPQNAIDSGYNSYYDLKISENGVVRRGIIKPSNKSSIKDLATDIDVAVGDSSGAGGSDMVWYQNDGTTSKYITLPENGSYVFSFRLYGNVTNINVGNSHYISSWLNSDTKPFDIAEIYIFSIGPAIATYSVNLTVSGEAGDKVHFKISYYNDTNKIYWKLRSAPYANSSIANKTSLLYWKIGN